MPSDPNHPLASRDAAIIGMACIFPGAPDVETYWRNLLHGVDAISVVPTARWDPAIFYDPGSNAPDRFYCQRGGFVDEHATFDALGFGVMPIAAQGAEPDQLIALEVAARALADAGYSDRPFARDRAGVILGRGNYIGAGMTRLEQHVRTAQQLVECLRVLLPDVTDAQLGRVKSEFQAQLGGYGPDTAIGLVPNLTASRIANRLDLHGSAYTVDAACASALVAVDQACRDLADGRADLVLTGGVHLSHDVAFWSVFCQLGALSRTEQIRPFDRNADGLLIGEGIGIVVLKRLEDAMTDDDRIYAVIRGTGVASDGRGATLMVPSVDGQIMALERAWRVAGMSRDRIGLIEAHGTATPVGDAAELTTLARFFGSAGDKRHGPTLGSVKSMIGHAMPAAGAAGLIKAALAAYHGIRPPTLHCDEPHELLESTRFRTIPHAEEWGDEDGRGLVAGVNAFGFGGINAHVVLENHNPPLARRRSGVRVRVKGHKPEEVLILAAATPTALVEALEVGRISVGEGPCRLALVDPTPERRARARTVVEKGKSRRGRDGLWYNAGTGLIADGGKLAFMFPGVEAEFAPRVSDIASAFGRPLPALEGGSDLERQGAGIVAVGRLLHDVMVDLGLRADAICGHSVGEWTGMIASGMIPDVALESFIGGLRPGTLEVPGVVFAAAGGSAERIAGLIDDLDGVVITHDNCPHQIILCGPEEGVDVALARLKEARLLAQKLPFRSGFHSPLFQDFLRPHRERLSQLALQPGATPLWSATTCEPYPEGTSAVRALAISHLVRPVRFRELIDALYADGARVFVQLGTGSLVGFVDDTLRGRKHLSASAAVPQRSGMNQLRRVAAALFVEGADVDWGRISRPLDPTANRRGLQLALGVPLVRLSSPLGRLEPKVLAPSSSDHPVMAALDAVLREVSHVGSEVVRAWQGGGPVAAPPPEPLEVVTTRTLSVATCPYLIDHCLLPQPEGWPVLADRDPVVPMTMSVRMMMDAATAAVPEGLTATRVEGVRAYRWLGVHPEVELTIRATWDGKDRVHVALEGYSEGTVFVAPHYASPPPAEAPPKVSAASLDIAVDQLYDDRWMFHGPEYQGVIGLHGLSDEGIRGTLKGLQAEGGLLDNAGQLFGYWVMATMERDRLAMPIKIEKLELFGPEPPPGAEVDCAVWIRRVGRREVTADLQLVFGGRCWARITGWTDWRFETDERLWAVMHRAELNLFSTVEEDEYCMVCDPERPQASRDYLARRFLTAAERDVYDQLAPARKTQWLYGRIAAKDAVRTFLWSRGGAPLFPVELELDNDEHGQPIVRGAPIAAQDMRISIAHKDDLAVAIARDGEEVGIDIERVDARGPSFAELACTVEERAMLPDGDTYEAWLTRFWVAKEVVAKARGRGIEGSPKRFVVTRITGERLKVSGMWVRTVQRGDYVIGWTE